MSRSVQTTAFIANDNDPTALRPEGDAAGYKALWRERCFSRRQQEAELRERADIQAQTQTQRDILELHNSLHAPRNWSYRLAVLALIAAIIATAVTQAQPNPVTYRLSALTALVWSGLWLSYVTRKAGQARASALSVLIAMIAGLGLWVVGAAQMGVPLSTPDGAAIFAGLALCVAMFTRAPMALLVSICAGLAWIGAATSLHDPQRISLMLFPALAGLQILLAGHLRSGLAAFSAIIAGYLWAGITLYGLTMAGEISPIHVTTLAALLGFTHYRIAKASLDIGTPNARLHSVTGWAVCIAAMVALQHHWQSPDAPIWDDPKDTPLGVLGWTAACYGLLVITTLAATMRWIAGRGSLLTSVIITLCAGAIFALAAYPDAVSRLLLQYGSVPAVPGVGLMIGAAVTVSALALTLNGVRVRKPAMTLIGLCGLGAEALMVSGAQLWTFDNGVIFGLGLLIAGCCAALLAAESTYPSRPAGRARPKHISAYV